MDHINNDRTNVDTSNARSPEQAAELARIAAGNFCPFCQPDYMEKVHGKPKLKDGVHWFATENRWPYKSSTHHLVFIHKRHLTSIAELGAEDWDELRMMVAELTQEFNIPGATFMMRFGDSRYTGGTVTHLHAQLVSGDGVTPVVTRVG